MTYDPDRHHRRSIRLQGYDYSQPGAYFVTICALGRECLFGEVIADDMQPTACGQTVSAGWNDLPRHYANVQLDEFVVMPNHVHGIIVLTAHTQHIPPVGAGLKPAPATQPAFTQRHGLPEIVRAFKTFSARRVNELRATPGVPLWQRNYYEHVIRDDDELNRIRQYIIENPLKWALDPDNPLNAVPAE